MRSIFLALFLLLPAAAQAETVLDTAACERLSAAYVPGVDVHGKPIVPADLNAAPVAMPEKFSFDVNIDAARAVGLPIPDGTQMQATIGTIVYEGGALTFNGKPLSPDQEANLKSLCSPHIAEEPAKDAEEGKDAGEGKG